MIAPTAQSSALEEWLPDTVVITDLKRVIKQDICGHVYLDSDTIKIPLDCDYVLVSKAVFEQRFDIGFGSCFKAVVAIGGVSGVVAGVIEAKYCFCTLWYTHARQLITTDFSKELL